jgi:prepilin-type N-terminal cleavage/methylation domain-containing protein
MKNLKRRRSGFSLLELLAVVTILGIIAAIVVPRVATSTAAARQNADLQNRALINSAVERFFVDTGGWPANDMSDMLPTATPPVYDYFPDGLPENPLNPGTPYSLNGTTHRVN